MVWLKRDARTGFFQVGLPLGDRRFKNPLRTHSVKVVRAALDAASRTLRALERGWATIPHGVDVAAYVANGGRLASPLNVPTLVRGALASRSGSAGRSSRRTAVETDTAYAVLCRMWNQAGIADVNSVSVPPAQGEISSDCDAC